MAIKLSSKQNVIAPGGNYPYGAIKNNSSPGSGDGTPVNVQVYGDMHQFFARLAAMAGITLNDLPENSSNGFQYFEALEKLSGSGAWLDAATPTFTPSSGTVVLHSIIYNKYKVNGKTLTWDFNASVDITGSPNNISVTLPATVTPSGAINARTRFAVGGSFPPSVALFADIKSDSVQLRKADGTAFSAFTGFSIQFFITCEID